MRAHRWFMVAVALVVSSVAWGETRFPDNPTLGARLFAEKGCFRCHSILGEGGQVGQDLGRIHLGNSQLDIASHMLNHAATMMGKMRENKVIWPSLTGPEIEGIVAYLYYVHYFDPKGESARGEKIFSDRGCSHCHAGRAAGGGKAPSLSDFPRDLSPIFLAKTLWNHGPTMQARMTQAGIGWPRFEETEIMDLVAYFKNVARGPSTTGYFNPGNPNEGALQFEKKGCTRCHGSEAGAARINLAERSRGLRKGLTQVVGRMWNHAPQIFARMRAVNMPVPQFTEKEMADLVAYLYFLNYYSPPPNLAQGQKSFVDKKCASCHSLGGGTSAAGPDLIVSKKAASTIEMTAAMWNHAPFMQSMMQERHIAWPHFEEGDLNDLLGYIQSLGKQNPPPAKVSAP